MLVSNPQLIAILVNCGIPISGGLYFFIKGPERFRNFKPNNWIFRYPTRYPRIFGLILISWFLVTGVNSYYEKAQENTKGIIEAIETKSDEMNKNCPIKMDDGIELMYVTFKRSNPCIVTYYYNLDRDLDPLTKQIFEGGQKDKLNKQYNAIQGFRDSVHGLVIMKFEYAMKSSSDSVEIIIAP